VAPLRLQSVIVRLPKLLPDATCTSKYSPDVEKLGLPTGSEGYWDTVTAPSPFPPAVVPSLVALQVPDEFNEEQFCELVAPDGGKGEEGGGGGDGAGVAKVTMVADEETAL
jgi:hypothetical protein